MKIIKDQDDLSIGKGGVIVMSPALWFYILENPETIKLIHQIIAGIARVNLFEYDIQKMHETLKDIRKSME